MQPHGAGMKRILLVEDEPDLRLLLEHVLLGASYRVDTAASVETACAKLGSAAYDLVVADVRLEDGSGFTVAEQAAAAGAKVLIITGYAFDLRREQISRYELLMKPVRPSELLAAVERVLPPADSRPA